VIQAEIVMLTQLDRRAQPWAHGLPRRRRGILENALPRVKTRLEDHEEIDVSADLDQLVEQMIAVGRRQAELEIEKQALVEKLRLSQSGPPPARPTRAGGRDNGTGGEKRQAVIAAAAERDERLLAMITEQPGLRAADIARNTAMAISTTSNALARLRDKALATRDTDGKWSAVAPAVVSP
jgi:hypothetical protein